MQLICQKVWEVVVFLPWQTRVLSKRGNLQSGFSLLSFEDWMDTVQVCNCCFSPAFLFHTRLVVESLKMLLLSVGDSIQLAHKHMNISLDLCLSLYVILSCEASQLRVLFMKLSTTFCYAFFIFGHQHGHYITMLIWASSFLSLLFLSLGTTLRSW